MEFLELLEFWSSRALEFLGGWELMIMKTAMALCVQDLVSRLKLSAMILDVH
jgi:hypothetical protein